MPSSSCLGLANVALWTVDRRHDRLHRAELDPRLRGDDNYLLVDAVAHHFSCHPEAQPKDLARGEHDASVEMDARTRYQHSAARSLVAALCRDDHVAFESSLTDSATQSWIPAFAG
jgi:hypothetical protein